jgi:hypothetical protein
MRGLLRVCCRVADLDLPNTDGEKGQGPRDKTKPYSCLHASFRLEVLPSFWQQGIVSNTRILLLSCEPLELGWHVGTLQHRRTSSMERKEDELTVRTGIEYRTKARRFCLTPFERHFDWRDCAAFVVFTHTESHDDRP